MACQAYLWALPLVSYAQWQQELYEVFGAMSSDIVHYVAYRDRLGLITANATTPYTLNFFDLNETGPLVVELPPGPTAGGVSDFWQRDIGVMGELGADSGDSNWVQTIPGRHWFSYFRFYGPLEPYFNRSWKLGDITPT